VLFGVCLFGAVAELAYLVIGAATAWGEKPVGAPTA